eukprot:UN09159
MQIYDPTKLSKSKQQFNTILCRICKQFVPCASRDLQNHYTQHELFHANFYIVPHVTQQSQQQQNPSTTTTTTTTTTTSTSSSQNPSDDVQEQQQSQQTEQQEQQQRYTLYINRALILEDYSSCVKCHLAWDKKRSAATYHGKVCHDYTHGGELIIIMMRFYKIINIK